jgi:hypothetical protein
MTDIVPAFAPAYGRGMSAASLWRFLAALALVLMPLGMISTTHAAGMGHSAAAASSSHCDEMSGKPDSHHPPGQQPDRMADCAIACSALPSLAAIVPPPELAPALRQPLALSASVHGLHPEAATPPPRAS